MPLFFSDVIGRRNVTQTALKGTFGLQMSREASMSLQVSPQDCISRLEKVHFVLHWCPKCVSSQRWDTDTTVTSASYSHGKGTKMQKTFHVMLTSQAPQLQREKHPFCKESFVI